jgi:hypothetical protein
MPKSIAAGGAEPPELSGPYAGAGALVYGARRLFPTRVNRTRPAYTAIA